MKKYKFYILVFLIGLTGFLLVKFAFRNSGSEISHVFNLIVNNNTTELTFSGIDKKDIRITWEAESGDKKIIFNAGEPIDKVDYEYGPNSFYITVDHHIQFNVGHFKTANWHSHAYTFDLKKDSKEYTITFIADGVDYEKVIQHFDLSGKINGKSESYFKNGNLSVQGNYKNGFQDGHFIYYNENGKPRVEENYIHGKLEGDAISYDKNGKVEKVEKYVKGKKVIL